MTVRLCGDGPSSWAIHCVVSRPRTAEFVKWGTLPGGYFGPSERQFITGGKPEWLLKRIIADYSKAGDLIADPCAGGATTLVCARVMGRRGVGAELDPKTYARAKARIDRAWQPDIFTPTPLATEQVELF